MDGQRRVLGRSYVEAFVKESLQPPIPIWTPPAWLIMLGLVGSLIRGGLRLVIRHPLTVAAVVGAAAVLITFGLDAFLIGLTITLVGAAAWGVADSDTFVRLVRWPATAAWRRFWIYRRHWQPVMIISGLGVAAGRHQYVPELVRVETAGPVDRVLVRMLIGQDARLWAAHAEYLARAFDAIRVDVYPDEMRPSKVWLEFTRPVTRRAGPRARARRLGER